MILENETSLQRWLSNQLKPISDADPLALAMYVIALLKHHDKKGEVLKNHCYEQLLDFLKENTRGFLESLFNVIKDGSYVTEITSEDEEVRQIIMHFEAIRKYRFTSCRFYDHFVGRASDQSTC